MPLEGQQIGRYRLLRLLGSGGMGEVYLASDTLINRQVSVKVIRAQASPYPDANATLEAARLFQREMKAIATLDHPHILPLFDYGESRAQGEESSYAYLVMPYRSEGSLTAWLQRRGSTEPLSPQEVANIVTQAAGALQHAHNHQIIHQDVKPSNFLMQSNEENPNRPYLLLADFGVAKFNSATASASQSVRGTPAYMAPEQWEGRPVPATDQYALAVMAYELLTGRTPFQGGLSQMMYQHFNTPPPPPSRINPRIPREVDAVLLRALGKKPEARFLAISVFARAFQEAAQKSTGAPAASTGTTPAPGGADIRATLAISATEALTGTSRTLTFPGGRRVTVAVPARAYDGQVIALPGLGEPASSGGQAGTLILTLAVQKREQPSVAGSAEQTARASNFNLENPRTPPLLPPPMAAAPNPPTPYPGAPPPPSAGLAPPPVRYGNVFSRPALAQWKTMLLVGLALLVIAGGVGLLFVIHANQVATANRDATVTANVFNATATAQTQATATASVIATNSDPYGGGTLALSDPLQDNSNSNWTERNDNQIGSCKFTGGAYHVSASNSGYYCIASPDFSNFAFEVQMTIIKGDAGGIIFRINDTNTSYTSYTFYVDQDGSYALLTNLDRSHGNTLIKGTSSAIHQGLGQTNVIAVAAKGSTITLYVNRQQIASVTDSTYSYGQIALVASSNIVGGHPTEVVYSNAKVWTL